MAADVMMIDFWPKLLWYPLWKLLTQWVPAVREVLWLKKEAFQASLNQGLMRGFIHMPSRGC